MNTSDPQHTQRTEDPADVRAAFPHLPDWAEDILTQAEQQGKKVIVKRIGTAFGAFVDDIKLAE
jgi:hypothetical protein